MSLKIKIGSYIIDGDRSASNASSTTGVRLALADDPLIKYHITPTDISFKFLVYLEGMTGPADVDVALDALEQNVVNKSNADLVIEKDGVEIRSFKVSTGQFSRITGNIYSETWKEGALCACEVVAERVAAPNEGAGDPANSLGAVEFDYAQAIGGLSVCSASCLFKTKAAAVTWVQTVRAYMNTGAPADTLPDFLPVATWNLLPQPVYKFERQPNQASPAPAAAYTPCRVTLFFQELSAALASVLKANKCKVCIYDTRKAPHDPLNEHSGQEPGYQITVKGRLEFQLEGNTSFDSGDTEANGRIAPASLTDKASAVVAAVLSDAATKLNTTWTEIGRTIEPTGDGSFSFEMVGTTKGSNGVFLWLEHTEIRFAFQGRVYTLDDGKQGVSGHKSGDAVSASHSLTVTSLGGVAYRKPDLIQGDRWLRIDWVPSDKVIENVQGGPQKVTQEWKAAWIFLSEGNGGAAAGGGGQDPGGNNSNSDLLESQFFG